MYLGEALLIFNGTRLCSCIGTQCIHANQKNPNELDVGKLVGAVGALGMGLFTIIGTIIAVFAKGKENAELRENNDALRAAGKEAWNIVE